MISVSLRRAGGAAVVVVVVFARVVDVTAVRVVVVDGEVVVGEVVVDGVVGVAAATSEVVGVADGMLVTIGAAVLVTEGSSLTWPAGSAGTGAGLTVLPERSAEAADEPHAAVPITANSMSTAICSLFTRRTLRLRQRPSPTPRKGPV